MRGPLQEFKGDNYERPNQPWLCGLTDEGAPCPVGPAKRGRCPGASACHPLRDGDRWVCNRSPARGGTCETGPAPDGNCCHVYRCTPLRSLRARRGRFVRGCLLATIGGLCLLLSSDWRDEALTPGRLSASHAQLLGRGDQTSRCASCHAAGDRAFGQWLKYPFDSELAQPSQTQLCLECHQEQMSPAEALWAHNLKSHVLLADSNRTARRRRDPEQDLACATCHHEHHGPAHDLTWMSNDSCQACHQEQYESFAKGHPEFDHWPTRRRTRIAFDHSAHQLKYFPKEKQDFACGTCHQRDGDGAFQQTLGYEATCSQCHDSKIEASWDEGIGLFSLPMIDSATLRANGHDIGQWPGQAEGDFDGELPPITKLLLMSDERAAAAIAVLGADFDFFDVDPDNPEQIKAAAEIVWATKQLLYDVSVEGQQALGTRVETVLGRTLASHEFSALTARLSPDNLVTMTEEWLSNLPAEMERRDTATAESTHSAPLESDREAVRKRVRAGGWYSDATTLSIRYHPVGHADPWVTAWIEVMTEAASGRHAQMVKPLLKQVMAPTAEGQCGSCHSVDRVDVNQTDMEHATSDPCLVNWFAKRVEDVPPSFTRFSHAPHLTQAQLVDCQACHQINPLANVMETYAGDSPTIFQEDFQPLTQQGCAECHTPQAAGDSCLQCHTYHVGGGNRLERRRWSAATQNVETRTGP